MGFAITLSYNRVMSKKYLKQKLFSFKKLMDSSIVRVLYLFDRHTVSKWKFLLKFRKDFIFERRLKSKFVEKIDQKTLEIYSNEFLNSFWRSKATQYQTSSLVEFNKAFRNANLDKIDFQNFYDIGSGKGKMVFWAERRKIANNCVGIEADTTLYLESLRIKSISKSNAEFIQADAATHVLKLQKDEKNLIFLFNPFDGDVLRSFLTNNIQKFRRSIFIYENDLYNDVFIDLKFVPIYKKGKLSVFQFVGQLA